MSLKKRVLNVVAKVFARVGVEGNIAERFAVAAPAAVAPRSHHDRVVALGTEPLDAAIRLQCPEQILGIEPAADRHDRRLDVFHVRPQIAGLPELIVRVVLHELFPERHAAFHVFRFRLAQRAHVEKELVAVRRAGFEPRPAIALERPRPRPAKIHQEVETVRELQRAVVMPVVAHEPVHQRRLRRRGLEGRVGIDHAGRRVEARVRNSPLADAAVVARHIFHEPIDRVPRVAGFVDVAGAPLVGDVRPNVDEFAFRHPAAAHILRHEDVPLVGKLAARPQSRRIFVHSVRPAAVGRADHQERILFRCVLGHVDGGVQPHAVAHRNHVFIFRVVGFDVVAVGRRGSTPTATGRPAAPRPIRAPRRHRYGAVDHCGDFEHRGLRRAGRRSIRSMARFADYRHDVLGPPQASR